MLGKISDIVRDNRPLQRLTFNSDLHIYRVDGVIVPSVTQLMKPLSAAAYKNVTPEQLETAARRGTAIHEAVEFHANYGLEEPPDEGAAYFEQYLSWFRETKPKYLASESAIFHPVLLYAGTLDLLAEIDGKKTLIDVKTTAQRNEMLVKVQLEAYDRALDSLGIRVEQKAVLWLRPRRWSFDVYSGRNDKAWHVFNSLIDIERYIAGHGG